MFSSTLKRFRRHLHLSDNLLEQLPAAALQTAPRLEVLSLHGNPWSCDCQLQWLLDWNAKNEGEQRPAPVKTLALKTKG